MRTITDIVSSFKNRNKTAVIYKTGFRTFELSYKELHEKIAKTAAFLGGKGLKKGDKILIWGNNSPEWGIVFLAAASKGIVIVPVDFLANTQFVNKIQSQVGAKLLFHSGFKNVSAVKIDKVVLEHLGHEIDGVAPAKLSDGVQKDDLLEIVYTSGTTGDPKGVMITHGNIISNIESITKVVDVTEDQTFLSLLPLSHLFEQNPGFLAPLSQGCTVVYMRGLRPNLIFKALGEVRVTNIVIVPRLLKLFESSIRREVEEKGKTKVFNKILKANLPLALKKIAFKEVHKKFGKHFEYFVSGGAPLSDELYSFWTGLGFKIVQGYGLTETAPVLTVNPLEEGRFGSVGRAVPGVELKLDKSSEVFAKGRNITQGYYKRTDKTKELFESGWMKTGDIGQIDDDGFLFIKGRKKDVIVTGAGVNVYPEDIEAVLVKNGAKDVAVVGLPGPGGEEVHAEIIPTNSKTDVKKLIAKSNSELNESQQITSFGVWPKDDFPRTTTMKIKKPLVLAEVTGRKASAGSVTKEDNHSKLATIIAKVCEIDPSEVKPKAILAQDLHLTSVNRIELTALIEQEFNLDINEEDISAQTTVKQLEDMIKKRKKVKSSDMFKRWQLSAPLVYLRTAFNLLVTENLLRIFVKRKVVGKEHIQNLEQPVIFISNHVGYFDAPSIIMSMPLSVKMRVAPAAWKEYFEGEGQTFTSSKFLQKLQLKFYFAYATVMVNAYPFPKKSGFMQSLAYTGELLDKDWHILFFPEGEHSPSGKMQPFRSGIGYIVKETKAKVVPIRHEGLEKIMAGDKIRMPKRGSVNITFGKPIMIDDRLSVPEIVDELEKAVKSL